MNDWKSCDNCGANKWICEFCTARNLWKPMPCPKCGGALSEIREQNGRKLRHCYSCHFESEVTS